MDDWGYEDYQYGDSAPSDGGGGYVTYDPGPAPEGAYWNNEVQGWQRATPNTPQSYAPSPSLALHNSWANGPSLYSQVTGGFAPQGYNMSQQRLGGGAPGGQVSMARQTPQQIAMGKPEDELYKRYKSLLMNPDFSGDPTYQFLYNQGLQALNRNLAAQRKTLSGQSMNDTMAYGAGMASKYMQDLLPQYRGGASEELQRFLGPAGLLPRYAGVNNAAIGQANNMVQSADAMNSGGMSWGMPGGELGLDRSGFTAGSNGVGWGGIRTTNNPGATGANYPPIPTPRPVGSGGYDPFEGLDPEMMAELGMES